MRVFWLIFALAVGLSLPTAPLHAQQASDQDLPMTADEGLRRSQEMAEQMPPEWFSCQMPADCGLVSYNCMHEAVAATHDYVRQVQDFICKTELCGWKKCEMQDYTFFSACEHGRCVTKLSSVKKSQS